MWTKNANLPSSYLTWQGGLDYIANMNAGAGYGGYTDWRLPNYIELRSLWDLSRDPALPSGHPFVNLTESYFSSSTPPPPNTSDEVFVVSFIVATTGIGTGGKADFRSVWPVRGVNTDPDSDGVTTTEESGPNGTDPNYDGNGDGIPDSQQTNVTSMHTFDHSNYVTLASPSGTSLSNVQANGNPSPGNSPPGVTFPYGFFGFTVESVTAGGSTTVTIYLPAGANPNTYYKFGPTPGNPTDHWYEFLYDGQTGAQFSGNVITLHFVDGLRGDDDLAVNGMIVNQGAPGFLVVDQTGPSLAITSHANNQDVGTASITLGGTASDSGKGDNGIQQVTVNGVRANNDTATGSGTANWSKVISLNPGANVLTVVAYDNSSNQTSQTITIYYDPIYTIYVSKDGVCNHHSHCWDHIQNGISTVLGPSIIEISQETYTENIVLDVNEEIMLEGGWDTNFGSCSSYTTIHGSMTITHGTIIIENIILK